MLDVTPIVTAVASSGVVTGAITYVSSRRSDRLSRNVDERNESREPFVVTSIQIGNASKVIDLLRTGLDELEDSKQRLTRDLRESNTLLEERVQAVTNENKRLTEEWNLEKEESFREKEEALKKISELNARLSSLTSEVGTIKEGVVSS